MANELAPNSVRTYRLAPEGFRAARNKLLRQRISLFAGLVVFLLAVQYKTFGDSWRQGSIASLLPALFVILIVLGALVSGVMKGVKRNQESWTSYELAIGEDFLIRRIKDFPELEIQRYEVTSIKESAAGLHVETKMKDRAIGIAPALIDYKDAKERLSRWMVPVQESQQGWMTPTRWMWKLPLLFLLLFGCFYMTTRSWIIIATGVPLLVGLSWSLWLIRKSVQVSAHMKRLSLFTFLPLLAVASKLIQAIRNWH
ncbi:MAG: hypothetical protein QOG55_979 [Acidobacteriaceae bacterium]|jgi:hypothetical protein|nr:hypothetical protein [Acidobacteriaceae bacterium]